MVKKWDSNIKINKNKNIYSRQFWHFENMIYTYQIIPYNQISLITITNTSMNDIGIIKTELVPF